MSCSKKNAELESVWYNFVIPLNKDEIHKSLSKQL